MGEVYDDDIQSKVNELGLIPITDDVRQKLDEYHLSINAPKEIMNYDKWKFVKWHHGVPYFYSRTYLQEHSLEELQITFQIIIS